LHFVKLSKFLAAATIYLLVFRLIAGLIERFGDDGALSKTNR
jgi:hypothetical protein